MRNDSYIGDEPENYSYNYFCTLYVPTGSNNCVSYHLFAGLENLDDVSINGGSFGYYADNLYVVTSP
jgi:hypothetical protein